ncbi:MAG: molybdopterin-dependent oxidoreductase [Alphaproteobacteria bacterium]|nr:molybdopterin-dependent oxidoreductase [Alphaproteobacteria bacterium]
MKFGMGQPVRRVEDQRFVTGQGHYTSDFTKPNQAYAAFVRSPHAHALLKGIDIAEAKAAPGVLAVLTVDDIDKLGARTMPCIAPAVNRDGSPVTQVSQHLLARGKVRWVGEAIAMVIAESAALARDAADLVMPDFEILSAAPTIKTAMAPDAPQLWEELPGNLALDWEGGDAAAVDAAFKSAAKTVSLEVIQNRVVANAMEPRAALGEYDPATERYTLTSHGQGTTMVHAGIAQLIMGIAPEKLRILQPDVGGGFGTKAFVYPEQPLVLYAARIVGRPVKWVGDRAEAFLADAHGRDMETRVELAFDKDARIQAMRVTGTANLGAYLSQYAPFIPTMAGSRVWGGVYDIPKVHGQVRCYMTNSAPIDAYRGAGRPEAAFFIERVMDLAASELGLDPVDLRRRNLIAKSAMPYTNWMAQNFDSGNFDATLTEALSRAKWDAYPQRVAASKARGRLRGRGLAYYIEVTGGVPQEPASIHFTDNGAVEVYVGTHSHGQGHETAYAQILAEKLGVPFESISIKQGDSDYAVKGGGTGGSRSLHMAGSAILQTSDDVVAKGKKAASQLLEAAEGDIEFTVTEAEGGRFSVVGTDKGMSIIDVALEARRRKLPGLEDGLDATGLFSATAGTYPNGAHICEVEIDPDTGTTDVVSYVVHDDFGRVINPMLVAGQVHGGVAQGLGQALVEHCVYDPESGQLITGSFMDYGMPRADIMPSIDFSYTEANPATTNPLGSKGCGEAGTVGALPVIINAIVDALKPYGVRHVDMPATPERVWRAINGTA